MTTRNGYRLFWGDFHNHVIVDRMEEVVASAKEHLDIYPVLCYPAEWIRKGKDSEGRRVGVREETTGNRPKFLEEWDEIDDTDLSPVAEVYSGQGSSEDVAVDRIHDRFDLARADVENPDLSYSNSPKIKVYQVVPEGARTATVRFTDLAAAAGDYYDVRASQVNGQYAWASPIWIE